jgi:hypothetical protein
VNRADPPHYVGLPSGSQLLSTASASSWNLFSSVSNYGGAGLLMCGFALM